MCPNSHASAERKKKKKKKKKEQRLEKRIKVKRKENKWKYIIYTITYLPGNDAKNLTQSKSWCLIPSAGVSK